MNTIPHSDQPKGKTAKDEVQFAMHELRVLEASLFVLKNLNAVPLSKLKPFNRSIQSAHTSLTCLKSALEEIETLLP
jgi:hypothetical protein